MSECVSLQQEASEKCGFFGEGVLKCSNATNIWKIFRKKKFNGNSQDYFNFQIVTSPLRSPWVIKPA